MRDILNGIFYVLRGGIAWRLLPPLATPPSCAWRGPWPASPKDLPPKSTVYGYFSQWRDSGLFVSINHHLVMADRERADAKPRRLRPSSTVRASRRPKAAVRVAMMQARR